MIKKDERLFLARISRMDTVIWHSAEGKAQSGLFGLYGSFGLFGPFGLTLAESKEQPTTGMEQRAKSYLVSRVYLVYLVGLVGFSQPQASSMTSWIEGFADGNTLVWVCLC
jgi:hypothetical protein